MNVIQSTGTAATQTVPHVHFHIVPRWSSDDMQLKWPDEPAESNADQTETLGVVRALLPAAVEDVSPEDRRQHLSFIQAIVTRMSQASSSSKTWLLPLVTLTYGYAITENEWWIAVLGTLAVVIFGLLDANYLKKERAFRKLYDKVASGGDIPTFSLSPALAGPAGTKVNYWPDWEDLRSWAIAPIYGPLLVAGIAPYRSQRSAPRREMAFPKQPDRANRAEILADSVRTGGGHTLLTCANAPIHTLKRNSTTSPSAIT